MTSQSKGKPKKHHHRFNDIGIHVNYCTVNAPNGNICPIAQDRKTGKIGKFIVVKGQGVIPD